MSPEANVYGLRLAASLADVDRRDVDTWARIIAGRPLPRGLLDLTDDEARRLAEYINRAAGPLPPRGAETTTAFPDVGYPPDYRIPQDGDDQ